MVHHHRIPAVLALVTLLLSGCSGRDGLGNLDGPPLQTLPFTDSTLPDGSGSDLVDLWGPDLLDATPPVDGPALDLLPDLPPTPCETDEDCPLAGSEPCFINLCEIDEMGTRFCRLQVGLDCLDHGPCTAAVCAPEKGCIEIAANQGQPCDDGDACTTLDQCNNGLCAGIAPDCDDGNACTADLCNPASGGCYHLDVASPCDDGNACTASDHCVAGVCAPGPAVVCDDLSECTVDSCQPDTGCVFEALPGCCLYDLQCSDGDGCTLDECVNQKCQHQPMVCQDSNPCTTDSCSPEKGCVYTSVPGCCQVDQDCTDNNLCTYQWCADGTCQYEDFAGCADNNPCTEDTCDPATGCVFLPKAGCCLVAGDCDDDNQCTYNWCEGNLCQQQPISCNDGNGCTQDECAPESGCFFTPVPGCCLTSSDCDDADACTEDWCSNKACQHKEVVCLDSDICTSNSCDAKLGCIFPAVPGCCHDDTECADTDPCTLTACVGHKCTSKVLACDDGNVCTADSCLPGQGCQHALIAGCCLDAVACNDADSCTADSCVANSCHHEPLQTPGCCQPDCSGKGCGPDGCGGSCGSCQAPFYCSSENQCVDTCQPDCKNKECGPDGCGTFCGICADNFACSDGGQCVPCFPQCAGKDCGPDGCGGSCGLCPEGLECESASGQCVPPCEVCEGPECFQDGFEAGELDGWSFEGDAEVIHNMGVTVAPQGWYMAFVGTGLSELELGKLQKTFCPPASKGYFGFKWRLYSAEFTEWCGSIYQDRFIVTIANGVQQIKILDLAIDDLCPKTACSGCGGKFIGLEEADVEFDYPDVWMTPWSTAFFELPDGFTDTPVTVTLEVSDVGDMVYVTAVLLDAIQFL
jgi:hypothetical protein